MAHQTPEDADGVEDPDCADNVQLEYCNKCHIKGHFEKVCRQDSTRRTNKRQPVHKLEDDDDEEDEEEEDEVTSVYSFNTLYNLKAMESEHIRPLWISTTSTSQVQSERRSRHRG